MTRNITRMTLLVLAFWLGTYALGWWAVPAIGVAWALISPAVARAGIRAGTAAALAWALLLVIPAAFGAPMFSFGGKLAAAMAVPIWALYAAELVFPFAAAWSAASLTAALRGSVSLPDTAG